MDNLGPITAAPNEAAAITDAHATVRTGAPDAAFQAFLGLAATSGPMPDSNSLDPVVGDLALKLNASCVNEPTPADQIDVAAIAAAITAAIKIAPAQASKTANTSPLAATADSAPPHDAPEDDAFAIPPFAHLQISEAPNLSTAEDPSLDPAVDAIVDSLTQIIAPLLTPAPTDLNEDEGAHEQQVQRREPAPQAISDFDSPRPVTPADATDPQTRADVIAPVIDQQVAYGARHSSEAPAPLLSVAPEPMPRAPSQATPAPVLMNRLAQDTAQDDVERPEAEPEVRPSISTSFASPVHDLAPKNADAETSEKGSSVDAAQAAPSPSSDANPTTPSRIIVMTATSLNIPSDPATRAVLNATTPENDRPAKLGDSHIASVAVVQRNETDAPALSDDEAPASTTKSRSSESEGASATLEATPSSQPAKIETSLTPLSAPAQQEQVREAHDTQEFRPSGRTRMSSADTPVAAPNYSQAQAAPMAPAPVSQTSGTLSQEVQGPRLAAAQTMLIDDNPIEGETQSAVNLSAPFKPQADETGATNSAKRTIPAESMRDTDTRDAIAPWLRSPAPESIIAAAPLPPTPEFTDAILRMEMRRAAPMKPTAAPDKTGETKVEPATTAPNQTRNMSEPASHVRRAESAGPHDAPPQHAHTQEPTSDEIGVHGEPDTRAQAIESPKQEQSAAPSRDPRQRQLTEDLRARALERQVIAAARDGSDQIRMQLYPPGLGQVILRIALDGGKLKLQARTTSAEAADALRDVADALSDALSLSGLQLASFDVSDEQTGDGRKRTSPSLQPASEKSENAFSIDLNA